MSTKPWIKFYPSDWRADPALRRVSIAARGLWIEMLCIMHEAEPYGHLNVKGIPLKDSELAQMVGIGLKECRNLLASLAQVGVSSTTSSGVVFSRRMVADYDKALKDQKNGKSGGNPLLKGGVNPEVKAQKPEARGQILAAAKKGDSPDANDTRAMADRLLAPYPDLANNPTGAFLTLMDLQAWLNDGATEADIAAGMQSVMARPKGRPPGSWSYFRGPVAEAKSKRLAGLGPSSAATGKPAAPKFTKQNPDGTRQPDRDGVVRVNKRNFTDATFRQLEPDDPSMRAEFLYRLKVFARDGEWDDDHLGAPPGHPACLVPADLLAPFLGASPAAGAGSSTATH